MNKLVEALHTDPDLAQVPSQQHTIMQMVYITTGCDYISCFQGIGKVYFLNMLYQHATFITSGSDPTGTLADTSTTLGFVRLVGCVYFKKHLTAFKFDTPETIFH